jgi:predicted nucleic acid-binding protein
VSFGDTNVLVYATADGAPFQDRARVALVGLAANEMLSISRQVLGEYLAVMTRPQTWGKPLSLAEA